MSTSVRATHRSVGAAPAYHHGDLRQALLDTARQLAGEVGIDGFSLREVSRRAGVSHTAAYKHFADRSALVRELATLAYCELAAAMLDAQADEADPVEKLHAIGAAYVGFACAHRAEFRFMFRPELCGVAAGADDALASAGRAAYDVLVAAVGAAHAAHAVNGDLESLTLAAWSIVHGLATLIVDGPDPTLAADDAQVRARARAVTEVLVQGMLTAPCAPAMPGGEPPAFTLRRPKRRISCRDTE